jgi:carboxyl-terminal processing protease
MKRPFASFQQTTPRTQPTCRALPPTFLISRSRCSTLGRAHGRSGLPDALALERNPLLSRAAANLGVYRKINTLAEMSTCSEGVNFPRGQLVIFLSMQTEKMLRIVLGAVAAAAVALAQSTGDDRTKADPIAYLIRALDDIQARSLRREQIDWPRLRKEALTRAAGAESTVDTYDAIRFALASLDDHHSSFHPTPDLEHLEASRKAMRKPEQKTEPAPQSEASSPFTGRYEPEGRLVTFGGKSFAKVVVTKCFPENDRQFIAFETRLERIVADLDRSHPVGWIVDLRGNVGGNIWPMLAGIGPLLGEGDDLGEFFTLDSHSTWKYRDGVAAEIESGKENPYPAVAGAPYKLTGTPNVAVLIDRRTGSFLLNLFFMISGNQMGFGTETSPLKYW